MKKILFFMILLCPIVLGGCSSDDDDWMDLDSKHLVGTWSTGTEGTHKYLKFENDGTGYYALLNGASFLTNYLFSKPSVNPVFSFSSLRSTFATKKLCGISKSLNQSIPVTRVAV